MSQQKRPNFVEQQEKIIEFLRDYTDRRGNRKYWNMMQEAANRQRITIDVELNDLENSTWDVDFLSQHIEKNTMRYLTLFSDAIDSKEMPKPDPNIHYTSDVFDCLIESRLRMQESVQDALPLADPRLGIPSQLLRRYEVRIIPKSSTESLKIRNVGAQHVGSLLTIQGIVTRITDVRPLMRVATYICDVCGNEIYQVVNKKRYSPIVECLSEQCKVNRNKRPVLAQTRGSKFIKFQEVKLQESPEEVPEGNVPRTVTIYAMGECTRQCTCGDKVTISGVWLPLPAHGLRAMHEGLTTNTYLHAMRILKEKKGYEMQEQDPNILKKVVKLSHDNQIYSKLARSIAPEIYGLEDVKKALLLLLVSSVTKQSDDGLKIRGDINILLMGDPGVAKSQLLKHITTIAPRAVYTTGKGSSGVGLTAAVIRDNVTRDMVLEGGALVLADMGICCIDEFDKMEESDRTAIYEVMEQQTISIAKAGITTSLNARTSILAAANPAFGRYDKRRSPEMNINMPAALISRFDLLFVLVDEPNIDNDIALARHITHVHQHSKHPRLDFEPFPSDILRAYITKARTYHPVIPKDLTEYIVACYVQMRNASLNEFGQYDSKRIVGTPRALLSILRLSQALARVRFSDTVNQSDVMEAMRLMQEAKNSSMANEDLEKEIEDNMSRIYRLIKEYVAARGPDEDIRIAELNTMLTTRGFSHQQIEDTLNTYQENDVWLISTDGETLTLLDAQ